MCAAELLVPWRENPAYVVHTCPMCCTQLQQRGTSGGGLCQGATGHAPSPAAHAVEHLASLRRPSSAAAATARHPQPLVLPKRAGEDD